MSRARRIHAAGLSGLAGLCVAAVGLAGAPSDGAQLALVAALVVLLGLPHGALDPWLAQQRWGRAGAGRVALFLGAYSGAVLVAGLAFWAIPEAALAVFLLGSAAHFGREDSRGNGGATRPHALEIAARGSLPVAAPLLFHPTETAQLLAVLLDRDPALLATFLARGAETGAPAWIAVAAALCLHDLGRGRRLVALEGASLALALALLPPLLGFALYFCGGHSLRYSLRLAESLLPGPLGRALAALALRALPFSLLAAVAGLVSWAALGDGSDAAGVRVLFVGLAALTLPHDILTRLTARDAGEGAQALAAPSSRWWGSSSAAAASDSLSSSAGTSS